MDIVQSAYAVSVGEWGIQPNEFWAMSTREWWLIFDYKYVQSQRAQNKNYIPRAQWDEGHARHKEKMRNGRTQRTTR